ncbi:hypothetical protein MBLNU230_g2947t1 [Neophaeotheca triangularis]
MSSSRYAPVTSKDDAHSPNSKDGSPSSVRYTPDTVSDDDEWELEDLEKDEGYELKEFGQHSDRAKGEGPSTAGAEDNDADDDEGSEDEAAGALRKRTEPRRRRTSSIQSFELYTPDEERRVRRKLHTHLVLFVCLLYLLSFLDRSNIGNAKVAGLMEDLDLSDAQFEWLLTAFYITYVLFEWMTLLYKVLPPHAYISLCVASWGVVAGLQALATSFPFLLVLRALLGIGEAAFGPGVPFYLSFFFKREELAFSVGLQIAAAPLATSFAGSLAWAVVQLGDHLPVASWRLLFLVEGFPSVLIAVWAWWWIPDSPSTARWLNTRERKIATLRLRKETNDPIQARSQPARNPRFNWRAVLSTLSDPKAYLTALIFFNANVAFSSMPVFLPTILSDMGYASQTAQALTAPPFLLAFVSVLVTAYLSDRYRTRSLPLILHGTLACFGYVLLALAKPLNLSNGWRYFAVFPICSGFFSVVAVVITWTLNNQSSDEGKGTGTVVLQVIGQLGPLVGTRLYPDAEGPYFVKGMAVCALAMGCVVLLAWGLRVVLERDNRRRRAIEKEPERYVLIGIALQSTEIYFDAARHLIDETCQYSSSCTSQERNAVCNLLSIPDSQAKDPYPYGLEGLERVASGLLDDLNRLSLSTTWACVPGRGHGRQNTSIDFLHAHQLDAGVQSEKQKAQERGRVLANKFVQRPPRKPPDRWESHRNRQSEPRSAGNHVSESTAPNPKIQRLTANHNAARDTVALFDLPRAFHPTAMVTEELNVIVRRANQAISYRFSIEHTCWLDMPMTTTRRAMSGRKHFKYLPLNKADMPWDRKTTWEVPEQPDVDTKEAPREWMQLLDQLVGSWMREDCGRREH